MEIPKVINGGIAVDDRGVLRFVNGFDFVGVKRFYQIQNHRKGFIRAWHGHEKDGKYVYVVKGSALIGVMPLTYPEGMTPLKFCLSDVLPKILYIPPGYYNGAMTLSDDTIIQYFSTATLEETKGDDIRLPYDKWNIWEEDFR